MAKLEKFIEENISEELKRFDLAELCLDFPKDTPGVSRIYCCELKVEAGSEVIPRLGLKIIEVSISGSFELEAELDAETIRRHPEWENWFPTMPSGDEMVSQTIDMFVMKIGGRVLWDTAV